ncbi:MAG: hypothetical protein WDM96_04930 [Lacunisphaera sp.]
MRWFSPGGRTGDHPPAGIKDRAFSATQEIPRLPRNARDLRLTRVFPEELFDGEFHPVDGPRREKGVELERSPADVGPGDQQPARPARARYFFARQQRTRADARISGHKGGGRAKQEFFSRSLRDCQRLGQGVQVIGNRRVHHHDRARRKRAKQGGDRGQVVAQRCDRHRNHPAGRHAAAGFFLHPLPQVGGAVAEGGIAGEFGFARRHKPAGFGDVMDIVDRDATALEKSRHDDRGVETAAERVSQGVGLGRKVAAQGRIAAAYDLERPARLIAGAT